jgi:hypothetical protein
VRAVIPDFQAALLSALGPDLSLCVECGSSVEAPALVIGDQWWCDPCLIATREQLEQPFPSWSESIAALSAQ